MKRRRQGVFVSSGLSAMLAVTNAAARAPAPNEAPAGSCALEREQASIDRASIETDFVPVQVRDSNNDPRSEPGWAPTPRA